MVERRIRVQLVPEPRARRSGSWSGRWVTSSQRFLIARDEGVWRVDAYLGRQGQGVYSKALRRLQSSGLDRQRFATRAEAQRGLEEMLTATSACRAPQPRSLSRLLAG